MKRKMRIGERRWWNSIQKERRGRKRKEEGKLDENERI
jgi:hypothetical protein